MRVKKPTPDQLGVAALWLRSNEGDGAEGESCVAVAEWIEAQLMEDEIRRAAREGGVPVKALRARLEADR